MPKENQKWFARLCAGVERGYARLSSLLRTKREPEKCPLLSRRGRHEKGAARPFQTPKGKSKRKKASRFAKRFFLVSPIYGFAEDFYVYARRKLNLNAKKSCVAIKKNVKL